MADPPTPTGREALKDEMVTDLNHSDGDRLVETRQPLDELDVELKDLGGDCIKVMQLLKADPSLLKDRTLDVLHLGVSRGCIEIVEEVVKFYEGQDSLGDRSQRGLERDENQTTRATEDGSKASSGDKGEDILGDRSETDQQGVEASREEEINAPSDNTDAPTVALDELQSQIDDKNEKRDPDPSHAQDDPIRVTVAGKGTRRRFSDFMDSESGVYDEDEENDEPVLHFDELLRAEYLYSGPARELDALEVAVVNGNLEILGLLLSKTPSVSRIGPKTRSVAMRELHRNQLRVITERVVESVRGESASLKICQSVFDAWRDDLEFNFLFWDFGLGQERVSEYLFHFLFTKRFEKSYKQRFIPCLRMFLWAEVWDYQGEPWEEPLWKSLLKLHDAQGRTPLHVAVDEDTVLNFNSLLNRLILTDQVEVFAFAMEATDGLGRTPWHRALLLPDGTRSAEDLSRQHEYLVDECREGKVDAPGIYDRKKKKVSYGMLWQHPMEYPMWRLERQELSWRSTIEYGIGVAFGRSVSTTTPLHSALLRGRALSYGRESLSARDTRFRCLIEGHGCFHIDALELATLTINFHEVKQLLTCAEQGPWKTAYTRKQSSRWGTNNRYGWVVGDKNDFRKSLPYPTIHIAAYSGNYEMLKVFLDSKICDPYIADKEGFTILHAVLNPKKFKIEGDIIDFTNVKHIPQGYEGPPAHECTTVGRQGCINLLLQSGCDILRWTKMAKLHIPKEA